MPLVWSKKLPSPKPGAKCRIKWMNERHVFPDQTRLSVVTAMILLAYASAAFVHFPQNTISLQLPGFLFVAEINFFTVISLLVAGMAAAGSDWVIADHPALGEGPRWHHWLLPSLTALVIGVPLNEIAVSAAWWVIFAMGGALFVVALVAEYISVGTGDSLYPFASMSLTVLALALFLILAITVRGAGLRLYAVLSAVIPATALVSARILNLRLMGKWPLHWIAGITVIVGQLALCLFYLPIQPIMFGLILLGAVFAMIELAVAVEESGELAHQWLRPTLIFAGFLFLSVIL